MNYLKKIISFLFLILYLLVLMPKVKVLASQNTYARILTKNAIVYQDVNLIEPLFVVPYTYYVKIEEELGSITKVSYGDENLNYPKIIGYIESESLTIVDYIPTNPYYVIKVSTDTQEILFNDIEQKNPYFNVPKNEVMYYLGEIEFQDNVLCYVYYSKKLGYLDKTCLNPFTITENQDKLPNLNTEPDVEIEENPKDQNSEVLFLGDNLQLIIIVGISIISISVVYFLFKPERNKINDEQNEFSNE